MAGALIGEAFLSASVHALCYKISSREFIDLFGGKKLDDSLLKRFRMTLLTLDAVLSDAEEKQIANHAVAEWLDEVKDAVFDAEDLLDEINTEVLQGKVEAESQTKKTQVWNFLSTSVNPFYQGVNGRIEELFQRLEHLAKQKDVLSLRGGVAGKVSKRTPTTSFVEHGFCTYGRNEDKEKLETLLLSDEANSRSNLSVITIVGMGGVGKTTLAQGLYNDDKMKEHFDVRAWVCVSEDFDALRVTKTLLELVTSKPRTTTDMSLLQADLREEVRGKKILFVLDDLWNENYNDWDHLRAPFTYGARGSKVIVTTRNKSVASIMHTVPIHYLEQLSNEDCWLLLAKHAFRNENPSAHPVLEEIGKKIAGKCNGLPLAAKALGGVLSCNIDYKEWTGILNSNLWKTLQDQSILPALRLSYHYLPTYLKQCFAYCSIFPKDYEFEKENVILLWMAVGLIPQAESEKIMEEVGEKYFDELLSRSLLQRSRVSRVSSFTMHDLFNDLAMFMSKEFCFRLDGGESHEVPKRVRHFSYMRGRFDTASKFKSLDGVKYLRTFLPMSLRPYNWWDESLYVSSKVVDDLLPALRCLRVMSLSRYKNITHLPDCIANHVHLRYMDLSYTAIESLPNTVCTLHNLQTLLLLGCSSLTELPAQMKKLISLRHLDISGTRITEMPVQMGSLKSLRTLTAFVVGKSAGSSIGELKELKHLRGKLSILKLENVVDAKDALRANLKDKEDIKEVELAWDGEEADDSTKERDVLDRLQPSLNLEKLTIRFYGGTMFPNWLGDSSFSNIQVMHLTDCNNCWSVPPVGQLPALKELCIERMKFVRRIGVEFYGGTGASLIQPFQCLEKLEFVEMPEWEEWLLPSPSGGQCPDFPRLQELTLKSCPKLRGELLIHLPCLKKLSVSNCGVLEERATTTCNTEYSQRSLEELRIYRCPGLLSLLEMGMVHNTNRLQRLSLSYCPSLVAFPRNGLSTTLTSLEIWYGRKLEFLSHEMMANLTSLQTLHLSYSCDSMGTFPLGIFPKLSFLSISSCGNLESLSIPMEKGVDENLSHLKHLSIDSCPKLVSFPDGGLPTPNLDYFHVWDCENLKSLPDRLHTLTALRNLGVYTLPNLESFPEGGLPPNLRSFQVWNCDSLRASVEYWGLQGLVSLGEFEIKGSEHVLERLLQEQLLPPTLHTLQISRLPTLKSLNGKGLQHLTSLQHLEIRKCQSLEFLPEEELQHLTSLQNLEFKWCDSLEFLPEECLPKSLSFLRIEKCSALKKRYENKKGKYWAQVAHIPCIKIDDQVNIL